MILAVTGLPGVGKSTVCKILEKQGAYYINTDAIVHKLYESNGLGSQKIEAFFGPDYLKKDGSVNRPKLRKAIFNNPQKLKILETFIHPFVVHEVKLILEKVKARYDLIVIEITVYRKEAKINELVDKWMIVKRKKLKEKSIEKYDLSGFHEDLDSLEEDFVVENEGDLNQLKDLILNVFNKKIKI